ncbi:NAD(P)/FAD-dependent oxidoreductase [Saccharospirillum mangrovi]|uniref:NAD(P)/FAD-dependent oxidoreductase n=1 Tax=Saccharospirillum mangrovi TaxID=2161747 RepID=UPI000D33FFEC|nr:FAD-dependent oxidoreductase [Saccharospirillum mangrovi]
MTTTLNPRTHGPDHPVSYYAATARYDQRYPQLTESIRADVCVVGGGFGGVNTALELAERGYSVVLLEAHRIGWGASGRNGGQLIRGIGHGLEPFRKTLGDAGVAAVEAMGNEAVDIVTQRIERYNIDCDIRWGFADLANRPRHWAELQSHFDELQNTDIGHQFELLPPERLGEVVGSNRYLGALVDSGSGHVHPLNLVTGEARAAADLGVRIFERSAVLDIVEGEPVLVKTEAGQVVADRLVLCGNAYVSGLNKTLAGKVLPAGSYVIATEPLDEATARQILPGRHAVCDMNVALDYYRLSADNRLLFGGLCNYSGRDPRSIEAALKPHLDRVFPALRDIHIDYQWGGMIGIGANRFPQIGRLKPNIYYAQAYSGHGVNVTHLAARVIAESMHGDSERLNVLEKVKHLTFPGGPRFRSPLLALGMLYFRMKDWV